MHPEMNDPEQHALQCPVPQPHSQRNNDSCRIIQNCFSMLKVVIHIVIKIQTYIFFFNHDLYQNLPFPKERYEIKYPVQIETSVFLVFILEKCTSNSLSLPVQQVSKNILQTNQMQQHLFMVKGALGTVVVEEKNKTFFPLTFFKLMPTYQQ